jgi:hypothetical protein
MAHLLRTPTAQGTVATPTVRGTDATPTVRGTDATPTVRGTDATPTTAGGTIDTPATAGHGRHAHDGGGAVRGRVLEMSIGLTG